MAVCVVTGFSRDIERAWDNISGWFTVWPSRYASPSLWLKCFTQSPITCVNRRLKYNSMINQSNLAPADTHKDKSVRNKHLKINPENLASLLLLVPPFVTFHSYTQNLYGPINCEIYYLTCFSKKLNNFVLNSFTYTELIRLDVIFQSAPSLPGQAASLLEETGTYLQMQRTGFIPYSSRQRESVVSVATGCKDLFWSDGALH